MFKHLRSMGLALLLVLILSSTGLAETVSITLLATSDLHGHIHPVDYFTGQIDNGGLAQVGTVVKDVRNSEKNVVLIDNGDTIEGGNSVLPYHYGFDPEAMNPMARAMNLLDYDASVVGNHEFNYGLEVLGKFRKEAEFPLLSANVLQADGSTLFNPYIIKDFGEVQVGIIGITTPKVPVWEKPENIPGLSFEDPVAVANSWVPVVRKAGADVVVLAAHTGWEKEPKDYNNPAAWASPDGWIDTNSLDENFALRLAEVPGVDVVIAGHRHAHVPQYVHTNGTVITEPGSWGDYISRVDLTLSDETGSWKVLDKKASTISLENVQPDQTILDATRYYHDQTWEYYTTPIGESTGDMPGGLEARFYDNALVELINKAQLWASGADISLAALFSEKSSISKGPISIQDIYGLYIYPNTLYKIEVTGEQLKKALEHGAKYFLTYAGQTDPRDLVNPSVRGYNWDIYAGIEYRIDLTKPEGQRVVVLRKDGADITPDQKFTLAVNNYRAGGGGGYTMFKDSPVLWKSEKEVRELIVEYVRKLGTIIPEELVDHNWSLLPSNLLNKLGIENTSKDK